jgi:hypothetical protein
MSPAPLLFPSALVLAAATAGGAALAVRGRAPGAFVGLVAVFVPSWVAWEALHAGLGDYWPRVPLVPLAGVAQLGLVVAASVLPSAPMPRRDVRVAAAVLSLACLAFAVGLVRARGEIVPRAQSDCTSADIDQYRAKTVAGVRFGVGYKSSSDRSEARDPVVLCHADIHSASDAAREVPLGPGRFPSGSVACPSATVLVCPTAHRVFVNDSGLRLDELESAPSTFVGNLGAFGPPAGYLGLALGGAVAGVALVGLAFRRLPRRRPTPGDEAEAHPYRAATPAAETAPDLRASRLAYGATALVLACAAPLVLALLLS